MPQIGTVLLVKLFSALLPPVDAEERTFYEILQVERNASNDDIRRAYKKLSLKLHPDKVAQRGESKREEAAAEYEKVQEAYAVLVNEEKRQKYDVLGSPTRYRFVAQGTIASPGALYENLTAASFVDKTRLMMLLTTIILVILTQPIVIAAKINQTLEEHGVLQDTSWLVIMIPYWITGGLIMILSIAIIPFAPVEERLSICVSILEQFLWYLGVIFLCLRWDGTWTSAYRRILTPIYLAIILRWTQSLLILRKVRRDVTRMVTVEFLEREILKGKSLEELDKAELDDIRARFLVITVAPDFAPVTAEGVVLEEEKIEEQKVEASPEFEAATEVYNTTFGGLVTFVVFGTIFLILVTRKLDGLIAASWWAVFVPVWIERGFRWILNLYHCVCGTVASDEVLLQMTTQTEDQNKSDGDGATKDNGKNSDDEEAPEKNVTDDVLDAESTTQGVLPKQEAVMDDKGNRHTSNCGDVQDERGCSSTADGDCIGEESKQESVMDREKRKDEGLSSAASTEKEGPTTDTDVGNGIGQEDEEYIHLDEETFRAWQTAYEQAEENAMQQQAKASSDCCNLTIQLILLCLAVAKIEQNWENTNPDDAGFNVFWILFPFFLFFGLVCCCCALLVYGAAPGSASELQEGSEGETISVKNQDIENPSSNATEAIVHPPTIVDSAADTLPKTIASDEVETTTSTPGSGSGEDIESDTLTQQKAETSAHATGLNMDDLD